jgi:hypothetical protein
MICTKSERECIYAGVDAVSPATTNGSETASKSGPRATAMGSTTDASPTVRKASIEDVDPHLLSPELMFDSPLTNMTSMPSPNSAPMEWYDLLAEDAINNIDKYNLNLDLDRATLSRRQSVAPGAHAESHIRVSDTDSLYEQWNSPDIISLNTDELRLFRHYVTVIGPCLDHFDPSQQFSTTVPRLAVHNAGVLKSLLAVAARHQALLTDHHQHQPQSYVPPPASAPTPTFRHEDDMQSTLPHVGVRGSQEMGEASNLRNPLPQLATQYYYECLHYLSQNLLYPAYSKSREIIATALLISTYEMLDAEAKYSTGAWERHLRGIFWIQRSQNNNGECKDDLRRSAWWQWIRQDIWVAFREGRRVLTIWRPTKRLIDLSPDELCTRVVYICGRCVDFAANEKKYDITTRIEQGAKLIQALEDWHRILPSTFQPIYRTEASEAASFTPVWIHPPSYASAIQTFHFARIIVLINQPSMGGMDDFRGRQRYLDESVEIICGIAMMHQDTDLPSAYVSFQALYAGKPYLLRTHFRIANKSQLVSVRRIPRNKQRFFNYSRRLSTSPNSHPRLCWTIL